MDSARNFMRCVLFPRHVPDEALALEAYMQLQSSKDKKCYGMSLGGLHLLHVREACHKFGCTLAARSNEEKRKRFMEKSRPFLEEDSTSYIGFYAIDITTILTMTLTHYVIDVENKIEFGLVEHYNLNLKQIESGSGPKDAKSARAAERTRIIGEMVKLLRGPERHICDEDKTRAEELSRIRLPPLGQLIAWNAANTPSTAGTPGH